MSPAKVIEILIIENQSIIFFASKIFGLFHLYQFILININKSRIYVTDQFIDLDNYKELFNYFDSSFFYKAYKPRFPQRIYDFKGDCFLAIRNKDIIIHHPFETFDVVVNFLNQAAEDKKCSYN